MAVIGSGATNGERSYVAIGREITYGTMVTCTAGMSFLSAGLTATKEFKVLEEIQMNRVNSNGISLGKTVEGEIESYYAPQGLAHNYLLQNAFGGGGAAGVMAQGDTAASGLGFTHTLSIGNFDVTYTSLSINMRKGDSLTGKVFEYNGVRVNECSFSAELDDALKVTYGVIAKDVTTTTNHVASVLSTTTQNALSFANGRLSVESSVASITSSTFWHIQGMSFKMSNNLNTDARRFGSDVIAALPAGLCNMELTCTIRFDTVTAWSHMMAGDQLSAEFEFLGNTMPGSVVREGIKMVFPKLYISNAGDPEVGGPSDLLTSEVTFAVLRDASSATGYAVKAYVTNLTSTYV